MWIIVGLLYNVYNTAAAREDDSRRQGTPTKEGALQGLYDQFVE